MCISFSLTTGLVRMRKYKIIEFVAVSSAPSQSYAGQSVFSITGG